MELRQIRYFEAVARLLHFTRAADELRVAQPALSLQIRQLETELGVQLFDRTTRRVGLTDAGETLLPSARRIIAEADEARARLRDMTGLEAGRVTIGAQQSLIASGVLLDVLVEFRDRRPGVDVVVREEAAEGSLAMLVEGLVDLVLAMVDDVADDSAFLVESLFQEEVVFVVGHGHRLVGAAVELPGLLAEPFIAFNEGAGLRRMLLRACVDAGFQPRIAYESGALGSIRAMAAAGLGVALLPLPVLRVPGPPVKVLDTGVRLRRTISLVRPAERYHTAAAKALTTLLRARLKQIHSSPGPA
ncbi:LysR family transcriptional regulator [Nonomuraea deserti]|uniref:LysR family transcriptional regulator n=1 Tax=Nonomuraea deserti TaxID=1848322 RepID=A0A4R4V7W6_9ACTN|nr:LysR family transcriptional regulator [Nonomuraea deserti]TDC99446.1 LysR family transcriptional regulator [Nonomuraea deserti]